MIILGIDPGSVRIGFGVVRKSYGKLIYVGGGLFNVPAVLKNYNRLISAEREIKKILDKFKPDLVGIEKVFFVSNQKTAIRVIETHGVIIKSIAERSIPIIELAPTEIKLAVTGDGKADKKAIAKLVLLSLNMGSHGSRAKKWPDDVFDALAIAIASSTRAIHRKSCVEEN